MQRLIRYADWPLVGITGLLVAVGLLAVWSYSPAGSNLFWRQLIWALVGVAAFAVCASLDYRIFRNHGGFLAVLYLGTLVLLVGLLLFAPETRGVRGWFQFGGASIQPVELAKLVIVLLLAKYFSRRHIEIGQMRHLIVSGIYVGAAVVLVLLQPDMGSALILLAVWFAVIAFSGIQLKHVLLFGATGIVVALLAWFWFMEPYQKLRVTSFLDPWVDPQGAGYNTIQAMIAAGSGELMGKGIGYGTQSHLNFLPEAETDFIFAAFAEETGFIGALLLLGLFGLFFWRLVRIGREAEDNFARLFVLGFGSFLFAETLVHLAINLGMLPVTGIVLPFISYGGSSLVTILAGVGILQSIRMNSRAAVSYNEIGG